MRKIVLILALFFGVLGGINLSAKSFGEQIIGALNGKSASVQAVEVVGDRAYTSKDEVAAYLVKFGKLPSNFITKREAQERGWQPSKGNLWKVTDKMSIGGDRFGNREGKLPRAKGRQYYECDIDYKGGRRGAKRLVYSNDGLIYYTGDHYATFTLLHGERK